MKSEVKPSSPKPAPTNKFQSLTYAKTEEDTLAFLRSRTTTDILNWAFRALRNHGLPFPYDHFADKDLYARLVYNELLQQNEPTPLLLRIIRTIYTNAQIPLDGQLVAVNALSVASLSVFYGLTPRSEE